MNAYPDNWPEIADQIKTQAGWQCEHCGHIHEPETGHTLTTHHLNGNKADCRYENLLACCQRCHLHLQAKYFPGQLVFPPYPWAIKRGLM